MFHSRIYHSMVSETIIAVLLSARFPVAFLSCHFIIVMVSSLAC